MVISFFKVYVRILVIIENNIEIIIVLPYIHWLIYVYLEICIKAHIKKDAYLIFIICYLIIEHKSLQGKSKTKVSKFVND